ncbi:MAG: ribosome maturation factor RimP [Longimicrobiales bacterium]
MRSVPGIDREMEGRVEDLGFDLVEVSWAGSKKRPILRVRIDRPGSQPGDGVSVDDCATVSRALEAWLDVHEDVPERYVLEVSSPGVERPLMRDRDFRRFAGEHVAVKGHDVLAGRARRLEGELLGLDEGGEEREDGSAAVRLRLPSGDEVRIPRDEIAGAHLVFTWK